MVARLVISPVVPAIVATFDSSSSVIGLALTGMWMAYACAQFPSGVLADRYGERTVILAAVSLTTVASAALALSPSVLAFVVFAVVLGTVAGLHYSVATTLLTEVFDNVGTAIGLHNTGAPLAGLLAPLAAAGVATWIGWRVSIGLGAIVALPVAVLFAWGVRPTPPLRPTQPLGERFERGPIVRLLTRPRIAYTAALAILFEFVWTATASFLPTFLTVSHGYSTVLASTLFSLYFIVHGLTQPGIGSLSDRYGREETAVACAVLGVIGYGLLIVGSSLPVAVVAIACTGTAMGWGAALLPRFMDVLSAEERSAGFGLVRTTYMVLSSTGSVVTGTVAEFANWDVAFGVFVVFLTLVCVAVSSNRFFDLGL